MVNKKLDKNTSSNFISECLHEKRYTPMPIQLSEIYYTNFFNNSDIRHSKNHK